MERAENYLKGAPVGKPRVRVHGNAAAVVADGDRLVGVEFHFDPRRVPGDGFIHRVVENFGHEVVKGALVGAADIHSRTLADRFKPFQHLDR